MKIDYIETPNPDGYPFVRIYEFQREDAQSLKQSFEHLANGLLQETNLGDICSVVSVDGSKLKFELGDHNKGIIATDEKQFSLILKSDGWLHIAGLTEVFCEYSHRNGFQWLTEFISNQKIELLLSPSGDW
jgi:hypothetical protein